MGKILLGYDMVIRYYVDPNSLVDTMASLQDQNSRSGSTSNPEPPPWVREVADSIATRPSRASSLISTRTRFSTTTFQDDSQSIDLSVSGHHFRISRDGSKVTSVNPGESLPPYPFSPVHESSQHSRPASSYIALSTDSELEVAHEPVQTFIESQEYPPAQRTSASPIADLDSETPGSGEPDVKSPVLPSGILDHSDTTDHHASDRHSGLGAQSDKANRLNSMAVRIQRAWRNYVQYRGPTSEPMSYVTRSANQSPSVTQPGSTALTPATVRRQAPTTPQIRQSDAAPVPGPSKSKSILDKELPIPGESTTIPVRDSGLSLFTSVTRRQEAKDMDRGSLLAPQSLSAEADSRQPAEPLSLRKWFTGEDTKRFRDTDGPAQSSVIYPPETVDSENDVSNHYTRMIRFIDRDHRRALHARDKEMAELRERLNEKDIVYRQELRARDFMIEDLKKRLDHLEDQTETEIERARNAVEDLWESRWKDRDFHLRERMQRMESEMQRTMEMSIAEREAAWSAKYKELRRIPEALEESLDN